MSFNEPGGRRPAPPPLRVVQLFINTYNMDFGDDRDELGTPARARRWFADQGLISRRSRVSESDLKRVKAVREGLRSLAYANEGHRLQQRALTSLNRLVRPMSLSIEFDRQGRTILQAPGSGISGPLGQILARVHDAITDGSWYRLKACHRCRWAYYDHSKNRSSRWCSMAVCGNLTKTSSYRRRRVGAGTRIG